MASTNLKKNADGYGYKYTELSEIHNYLEQNDMSYYQYIEPVDGVDYIWTVPIIGGEEKNPRRGCRVAEAKLSGKSNPAQEQGSALTYARRYSLLMAFGLATTDDDASCLTVALITDAHANEIKQLLEKGQRDVKKFLGYYKVASVEEMNETQYQDAYDKLTRS